MNKATHNPHHEHQNLRKGGTHPLQHALTIAELDAQLQRDIDIASQHAAERIAAAKQACEDRRKRKQAQPLTTPEIKP